jgi:hypothetical protein
MRAEGGSGLRTALAMVQQVAVVVYVADRVD